MCSQRIVTLTPFISLLIILYGCAEAQQVGDPGFDPRIDNPAYPAGTGPTVLIDGAHNNFHTAEGRYNPFAELLSKDGFRVTPFETSS